MVERTRGGLCQRSRKRRAVPVLDNQGRDAESGRRAKHGPDIMWIGDLIEHRKRGRGIFGQVHEEFLKAWLHERLDMQDSALMDCSAANKPVEIGRKQWGDGRLALGDQRPELGSRIIRQIGMEDDPLRIG